MISSLYIFIEVIHKSIIEIAANHCPPVSISPQLNSTPPNGQSVSSYSFIICILHNSNKFITN